MARTLQVWSPVQGDVTLNAQLLNEILGGGSGSLIETAITTNVGGTLTAAGLVGGQIARTGPTAAYTDTLATAALIQVALQGTTFVSGQTFVTRIKNGTAYPQTLGTPGGTVVLPAAVVIPPFSIGSYFATVGGTQAAPTITFTHIGTAPIRVSEESVTPLATALTTNGAGTITAAGIAGGITLRTGSTSAFTDITGTGTAIIAAAASLLTTGAAAKYKYVNNTVAAATLTAGVDVTISGASVIPANSWVEYVLTRTGTTTVTLVAIAQGYFPKVGTTAAANGATPVAVSDARVTASSIITLTINTPGGTAHGAFVSAKTAASGFSINSLSGDTSTYDYEIRG